MYLHSVEKRIFPFCQALAAAYPEAAKIHLVLDNLNTHDVSAFYENLPADEAFALAERFSSTSRPNQLVG